MGPSHTRHPEALQYTGAFPTGVMVYLGRRGAEQVGKCLIMMNVSLDWFEVRDERSMQAKILLKQQQQQHTVFTTNKVWNINCFDLVYFFKPQHDNSNLTTKLQYFPFLFIKLLDSMLLLHYCLMCLHSLHFPCIFVTQMCQRIFQRGLINSFTVFYCTKLFLFFVAGRDSDEKSAACLRPKHEVSPCQILPFPPHRA